MTVLILERVPRSLRGELSRWLIEPRVGVFLGNVSALVRDKLWDSTCQSSKGGAAVLLYSTNNEQGYDFRLWGSPNYVPEEFEGLLLVRRPAKDNAPAKAKAGQTTE